MHCTGNATLDPHLTSPPEQNAGRVGAEAGGFIALDGGKNPANLDVEIVRMAGWLHFRNGDGCSSAELHAEGPHGAGDRKHTSHVASNKGKGCKQRPSAFLFLCIQVRKCAPWLAPACQIHRASSNPGATIESMRPEHGLHTILTPQRLPLAWDLHRLRDGTWHQPLGYRV